MTWQTSELKSPKSECSCQSGNQHCTCMCDNAHRCGRTVACATFLPKNGLVIWCFEPSQPQRIASGLNTNFNLSPIYSFNKSLYHKSFFLFFPKTTAQILSTISESKTQKTCFWAYLYSVGTQHGNLKSAWWPILFCSPTQEPVLATANTGKNRERFWKKCRWMDRKGKNKQGRNPWQ